MLVLNQNMNSWQLTQWFSVVLSPRCLLVSMSEEEEASPATPVQQLMIGAVSSGPGTHWVT